MIIVTVLISLACAIGTNVIAEMIKAYCSRSSCSFHIDVSAEDEKIKLVRMKTIRTLDKPPELGDIK